MSRFKYIFVVTYKCLNRSQELFCIGTDISLKALNDVSVGGELQSLATLATAGSCMCLGSLLWSLPFPLVGSNSVPLTALIQFVHLSFSYEQYEVLDMLGGAVVKAAMVGRGGEWGGE